MWPNILTCEGVGLKQYPVLKYKNDEFILWYDKVWQKL